MQRGRRNKSIPQDLPGTQEHMIPPGFEVHLQAPIHSSSIYIHQQIKMCPTLTHSENWKGICKEMPAVLSQSVDTAHAVLIQIRMLQLKENCVIMPDFHPSTHKKIYLELPNLCARSASFAASEGISQRTVIYYVPPRCHILQRHASKGRNWSFFLASSLLANISEVNRDLVEA